MNHIKVMKLALNALESYKGFIDDAHILEGQWHWIDGADNAITALREALEEQPAQQEPVAMSFDDAWASLRWAEWRMRPPKELFAELHRLTSPPAQQEPVAVVAPHPDYVDWLRPEPPVGTLLYTSQSAQRKPLTDEEIIKCWGQASGTRYGYVAFARAIEAAHGVKGGA